MRASYHRSREVRGGVGGGRSLGLGTSCLIFRIGGGGGGGGFGGSVIYHLWVGRDEEWDE